MDPLEAYRRKRNPGRTPEPMPGDPVPAGAVPAGAAAGDARPEPAGGGSSGVFVVQEHRARRLHWDFRLERDGVLVSWAIPKGMPTDPAANHLANHTEDHPLAYAWFAGQIPAGEYGAGSVTITDRGTYDTVKWQPDEVKVVLRGQRLTGGYALFQTGDDTWMIHRERLPLPERLQPMLARLDALPPDDGSWALEMKWDGVRALVYAEGGRVRLVSRTGQDITMAYPELRGLGAALGRRQAVLDGEIVALTPSGWPDFEALQPRIHVSTAAAAVYLAAQVPVTYLAFDLLHLDGRPLLDLPYTERRALLESLGLHGPHWQTPPSFTEEEPADVVAVSRQHGLEGVVAKRLESRYEPGKRSGSWRKVKNIFRQEAVVGGWRKGQGNRAGTIGSLLLGLHGPEGLVYAGHVGTGFTRQTLEMLTERLAPLRRDTSPFATPLPPEHARGAVWAEPVLVVEVAFTGWTREGRMRAASYQGVRLDKDPAEVVRELPAAGRSVAVGTPGGGTPGGGTAAGRVKDKGQDLGLVRQLVVAPGRAGVRASAKLGPEQQPPARRGCGPQPRHPLGRLMDQHPRIMHAPCDQERRPPPGRRVVVGAVGLQVRACPGVPRVPPFVPLADRQRNAGVQHGRDTVDERDLGDHGPPPPRGHAEHRPLQQAPGGQATGDDAVRRDPAARGKRVGGGDEVGERVALAVQPPVQPPAPAALAAAAHVRDRVEVAAVEQAGHRQAELRPLARLVRAVAVEQAGGGAVAAEPGAVGDRDRDLRAVRRRDGDPLGPVPGLVMARHPPPLAQPPLAGGEVHVVPGRRVDQRFGAHHDARRPVFRVLRERQRDVRATGPCQPFRPRLAVNDPQLRRRPPPLRHHQMPAEHVTGHQPGVRRPGDYLGPPFPARGALGARRAQHPGGHAHQPELDGAVVGDQVELPAPRAVRVIRPVLHPRPPLPHGGRGRARVRRRDEQYLGRIAAFGLDEDERPAPGGAHGDLEPLVGLLEHKRVLGGAGADVVPPHLVRAVEPVGDGVEHRPRARRPGQRVVAAFHPLRQVGPGCQVTDAQLVDLVAVEVDRVGEQQPVRADLADAERHVARVAGGVVKQQVLIEQHLFRPLGAGQRAAAELLVVQAGEGPGEVVEPAAPPAGRFLGRRHAGGHLGKQRVAQRRGVGNLPVVVRPLGRQVLQHGRVTGVPHPRVRVRVRPVTPPGRDGWLHTRAPLS